MGMPYEDQEALFRRLPIEFAAALAPIFPCYDTFVLLQSLPKEQMIAVIENMNSIEHSMFLDELPETAWQQIVQSVPSLPKEPVSLDEESSTDGISASAPIIEARGIEKGFRRPGGGYVQVIAPTNLLVESGVIIALLGPSGSGKSALLRMLSGLAVPWPAKCCGTASRLVKPAPTRPSSSRVLRYSHGSRCWKTWRFRYWRAG
jgi:ABC-type glutathione transport system ATPase component